MADRVQGCREGAVYIRNILTDQATECAAQLTKETGQHHTTQCKAENIGDGHPHTVWVNYCTVIKGQSYKK